MECSNSSRLLWSAAILVLSIWVIFLISPSARNSLSNLPKSSNPKGRNNLESKTSPSVSLIPVETTIIKPVKSYQVFRTYTGTIVSRRSSALSFELAGKLTNIIVDEGDRVESAIALAFLDTSTLKIKQRELLAQRKQMVAQLKEMQAGTRGETIAAARASVRQLKTELELAHQKSDRRKKLYTEGAISQEQRDEAVNEVATVQARVDREQSQLDELLAGTRSERIEAQQALIEQQDIKIANLELELEKSVLKAPFTGRISARLVDEGTVVEAGQSIFRLVEDRNLEAHIGVPVTTASQIRIGETLPLQIGRKSYQAKVSSILPELDPNTRTLTIILRLKQGAVTEVFSGQVARLQLTETINTSGYWLPTTALVEGQRGLWSCYVLGKREDIASENKSVFQVEQKTIEILYTQSDRNLVRGTLQPNNQVIIDGIHRLVPGQLVTVTNEP